jgi:hypothetical protein
MLYIFTEGPAEDPAQFRQEGRCRLNRTRIYSLGLVKTRTADMALVRFRPIPGPEVTVQNRCEHYPNKLLSQYRLKCVY